MLEGYQIPNQSQVKRFRVAGSAIFPLDLKNKSSRSVDVSSLSDEEPPKHAWVLDNSGNPLLVVATTRVNPSSPYAKPHAYSPLRSPSGELHSIVVQRDGQGNFSTFPVYRVYRKTPAIEQASQQKAA